jgi:glucose/arabinose dehydrogenase
MNIAIKSLGHWVFAGGVCLLLGCPADGGDVTGNPVAIEQDAAVSDAATAHDAATSGGDAGAAQEEDEDAGSAGTEGIERDVLRPVSRTPSPELMESLELPPGFQISVFARDLQHARMLAVHERHIYLTRPMQGDVVLLTDTNDDGVADSQVSVASNLPLVHGIAIDGTTLFLATPTEVYRSSIAPDGQLTTPALIINDLPAGGQHPNRTLGVGPDRKLYISVGSPCDACAIDDPEDATLLRADLDGRNREIFASGLRNTIGFDWHPETGALWGMDHGSDWRGDDIPPEELNLIEQGKDYGWPYCFADRKIDPVIQQPKDTTKEAYCAKTQPPVLTNQAHEAPIGWAFYTADQFPDAYRNSAFIAFRGSWNRIPATGYKIARVLFEAGQRTAIEDFVSGFLIEDGTAQFGRLAGVAVAADGSLLFTDDENGVIYRVQYTGNE